MLGTPFSPWPSFTDEEAEAVKRVLLSNRVNYWTGEECRLFETEFASYCECEYAVALSNGTVALDLALKALGLGSGDEVIVTSRTFLASVSSVVNAGAIPVFADIDRDSQNLSADDVARRITPRTRAILAVHLAGWPCDMDALLALANENDLFLIEDCAQAHGARYRGSAVGAIGHIGCWSFCQDKIMTTGGEGGMITTNDPEIWSAVWSYKDHGKSWEAVYERKHEPGFRWLHESFGTNARMIEMEAVIGRIQLARMPSWSKTRRDYSARIEAVCRDLPALRVPPVPEDIDHARYKQYVFVRPERLRGGWSRDRIASEISERGVPCLQGSCSEVYLEKAFEDTSYRPAKRLPIARELGETSLMFLVHPTLKEQEIVKTCETIHEVLSLATEN